MIHVSQLLTSLVAALSYAALFASSAAVLPAPSHSTVSSDASVSIVGGVVSSIVKVAVVVLALPQSSEIVRATVALPVSPQSSLKDVKLLLQVTPLHTSLAAAPPFAASHALSAAVLPAPSHSTVSSDASVSIVGGVVSSIVKVAVVVLALPQSSVAVKLTVALPVAPQSSLSPL